MSTKTLRKRIALVAVASLGFGLLSSVTANAATGANAAAFTALTEEATVKITAMKVSDVVVRKGSTAATDVSVSMLTGAAARKNTFNAVLLSAPATSALNNSSITLAAPSGTPLVSTTATGSALTTSVGTFVAGTAGGGAASIAVAASDTADGIITAATNLSKKAISASITTDVAGVYKVLIWNDQNADGLVTTGEKSATFQVTAGDIPATMTLATVNASAPTYATASPLEANNYGSLTTLSLKDAAGNLTKLASGEGIALVPSTTTATIDVNAGGLSTAGATVNLTSSTAVNSKGLVAINVRDTAAGTTTLTATPTGVTISTIPAQVVNITYKAATEFPASGAVTISTLKTCSVTTAVAGATTYTATNCSSLGGTITMKYTQTTALADAIVPYFVKDAAGANSGISGANYTSYVTTAAGVASFSVKYGTTAAVTDKTPASTATAAGFISTTDALSKAFTITTVAPEYTTGTVNVSNVSAVTGGTISLIATAVDQFGAAVAGQVAAFSIAGRNATTAATNVLTDATGTATYSYTDKGTTGTDTVSFTIGGAAGASTSVSYAATNAVSSVLVDSGDTTAGVANLYVTNKDIAAGLAGPSATTQAVSATITNASAVALVGVPVTWTVAGTGCAIPSTKATSYTDSTGVATSAVYAWLAGKCTVTATASGKTGTGVTSFRQESSSEIRTLSGSVTGQIVTAAPKDRFGNPVVNGTVYAVITAGNGYFGSNGARSATLTTDGSGTATVAVAGGDATVKLTTINPAGTGLAADQSTAAAGNHLGDVATPVVFTATTVGTTTTAETGVGATFSAAGVSSVTVEVTGDGAAQSAADAAAEATDAANAATDAANAAAEAADAATAAAQDAADAVAALSTQVSEMVNALKKQITALTNLVIKIQKKVKA
jgi:hypothetical protein